MSVLHKLVDLVLSHSGDLLVSHHLLFTGSDHLDHALSDLLYLLAVSLSWWHRSALLLELIQCVLLLLVKFLLLVVGTT